MNRPDARNHGFEPKIALTNEIAGQSKPRKVKIIAGELKLPIAAAAAGAAVLVAVPPSPPALVAAKACRVLGVGVAEQGLDPWTFGL